jgi:hypothetical protein
MKVELLQFVRMLAFFLTAERRIGQDDFEV